jgi:hypothetical protein
VSENDLSKAYARHAAAERAIGYRMGIEAAAKVAAKMGDEWNPDNSRYDAVRQDEAHGIADAIRALSDNAEAVTKTVEQG